MPIPTTKRELLDAIATEHRLLSRTLDALTPEDWARPGVCHDWSAKDVVAHLLEWQKMFLGWYDEGLRGGNPKTPAEDLNWRETRILNDRIYRKWKNVPLKTVLADFAYYHAQMVVLTHSLSQTQLFTKDLFPWLRAWTLARWIAAQTSSHYRWARTRIRKAGSSSASTASVSISRRS